ncbi:hypothetical protein [Actinoplanes sp. NPDC051411]|uniref:hypothetical protein n=1 Tax=Actinoplanes sp. NPDC051411 TaxID=3155522 RepID=UPI00344329CF
MTEQIHHRPARIDVDPHADPGEISDPMVMFTYKIATHLAEQVGQPLDAVGFWRFSHSAPAVLDGWTRHEITVAEHTVVITSSPDGMNIPQYRVTVDDQEAPYRFTLDRPLAELLAEAAHRAITGQSA